MILTFVYKNWRNQIGQRTIRFYRLYWGTTLYHVMPQLLMDGLDLDKLEVRTFAVKDILEFKEDIPLTKPRIIIVEGAKGSGKSTVTNALRDSMPYTQLVRLSGVEDKSIGGRDKIFNVHLKAIEFAIQCKNSSTNFVFDRSYLSERVFCQLVDKPYTFEEETERLHHSMRLVGHFYKVDWYLLTASKEEFAKRLERGKIDDKLINSSAELSIRQQDLYFKEFLNIPNINSHIINTDDYVSQEIVNKIIK